MLGLSIKRIFRDKIRFACLVVVFTLATALLGLALCLFNSSAINEKAMEDSVQTIAIRQDVKEDVTLDNGFSTQMLKKFDEALIDEAINASGVVLSKTGALLFQDTARE